MMKKKPLTNKSGDVRELQGSDIHSMQAPEAVLPAKLLNELRQQKIDQLNRDIELGLSQIKSGKIVSGETAYTRVMEKIKAISARKK